MSTERDSSAANQLCQKYGKLQSNSEGFTFDEARQAGKSTSYGIATPHLMKVAIIMFVM